MRCRRIIVSGVALLQATHEHGAPVRGGEVARRDGEPEENPESEAMHGTQNQAAQQPGCQES
jgi:hypothetical protein